MISTISQYAIMVLGPLAVFLVGVKDERIRRWGYVVGLLGQVFWFAFLYQSAAWPVFVAAFVYTYSWGNGFRNHWKQGGAA